MCKRKLDKYQLKAIKSKRKIILLLAGAGCGKTYTIVNKVRYMIENLGVKKEEIVCISFTNDSVNKLKKDLIKEYDGNIGINIYTDLLGKNVKEIEVYHEGDNLFTYKNKTFKLNLKVNQKKYNASYTNNTLKVKEFEIKINKFDYSTIDIDLIKSKLIDAEISKEELIIEQPAIEKQEVKKEKTKQPENYVQNRKRPIFKDNYERYEWHMKNGCIGNEDRQWVSEYIRSEEFKIIYEKCNIFCHSFNNIYNRIINF